MKIQRLAHARNLEYDRYLALQARLRQKRRELLLVCNHPPTITAGVQSRPEHLLASPASLAAHGIGYFDVKRGGDHTAHEPGQLVFYPHIDLKLRHLTVHTVFDGLLRAAAIALDETWGIQASPDANRPGLYLRDGSKIASIGIMFKSFFTSHGIAVNISNDLRTFEWINPCGEKDLKVTSVLAEKGDPELKPQFLECLLNRFDLELGNGEA